MDILSYLAMDLAVSTTPMAVYWSMEIKSSMISLSMVPIFLPALLSSDSDSVLRPPRFSFRMDWIRILAGIWTSIRDRIVVRA